MSEFIGNDGITTLSWKDYLKRGNDLRKNKNLTAGQIKELLGKPVIDGQVIEITTMGPSAIKKRASRKKSAAIRNRKKSYYKKVDNLPREIRRWGARLDREGLWPEGKSLQGFIDDHNIKEKALFEQIEGLKKLGFIDDETGKTLIDDGHLIALGNTELEGTPLRSIGMHGADHADARVPELAQPNQGKSNLGDIDPLDAKRAGLIDSDLEAFSQYVTGDTGVGTTPTQATKQRIAQGANPDQAIAKQIELEEFAKQRQGYQHLLREAAGSKITKGLTKATSATSTAEALLLLGSGQVVPGSIALAMQTPAVQKQVAKKLVKPVTTLLAKQGLKMIPGVSIFSGVVQGAGYLATGQYGKAAISTAGGIIGEFGPAGDAVQAMIDLGLTAHDIKNPVKTKTTDVDSPNRGVLKTVKKTTKALTK